MFSTEERVRKLLLKQFESIDISQISNEQSLFDELQMDSLNFLRMIVAIEKEFGITVDERLLSVENFETIEKIINIVTEEV